MGVIYRTVAIPVLIQERRFFKELPKDVMLNAEGKALLGSMPSKMTNAVICILTGESDKKVSIGVSLCSESDTFEMVTGKSLALARAKMSPLVKMEFTSSNAQSFISTCVGMVKHMFLDSGYREAIKNVTTQGEIVTTTSSDKE